MRAFEALVGALGRRPVLGLWVVPSGERSPYRALRDYALLALSVEA